MRAHLRHGEGCRAGVALALLLALLRFQAPADILTGKVPTVRASSDSERAICATLSPSCARRWWMRQYVS